MNLKTLLLLTLAAYPLYAADLKELANQVTSDSVQKRRAATDALGKLGEQAVEAAPTLRGALSDEDEMVRANAAWALGKTGVNDAETIQRLIRATGDSDWTVRHNARLALAKMGQPTIQFLEATLKTGGEWERFYAADILVHLDKKKLNLALPTIVTALRSSMTELQIRAASVVSFLGKEASLAASNVVWAASSPDSEVRAAMVTTAGILGSAAKEGVPTLIKQLEKESDNSIRSLTYATLASIGEPAKLIVPVLIKGLSEKKDQPRTAAIEALVRFGPSVIPALQETLQAATPLSREAVDVLAMIGPPAKEAVPTLLKLLEDKDWILRLRSASALGAIGVASDQTFGALRKAEKDENESVRSHAAAALAQLENKSRL